MDYQNPDYSSILFARAEEAVKLRLEIQAGDTSRLEIYKAHYPNAPWDFISDWGVTFDPRNIKRGLPSAIPMVLWDRQREYLEWLLARWLAGERGLVKKCRDAGVTWLCVGFAVCQFLFRPGFVAGFGSRKEELVDQRGDDKAIFEKVRFLLANLPKELLPIRMIDAHMRIVDPSTGSALIGEAGDNIGRGGRSSIYFADEKAFMERQEMVDAALSQNTDCQIDVSTPNGNGNLYYKTYQQFSGTPRCFIFDWREDPRKDDGWYQQQTEELDPVILAQEVDGDFDASAEDIFIPAKWVSAAIDAHIVLGFHASGIKATGFDPSDIGDAKGLAHRHGSIILEVAEKRDGDITDAIPWAFTQAQEFGADQLIFDGDGLGAPSMKLALKDFADNRMDVTEYHGSAGVWHPDEIYGEESRDSWMGKPDPVATRAARLHYGESKRNIDVFTNYRAQTWSWARDRFRATYIAVRRAREGRLVQLNSDVLISISSKCQKLREVQAELSRPKRVWTSNGKIKVEAKADMRKRGVDSPNMAEALIMALSARPVVRDEDSVPVHQVRTRMGNRRRMDSIGSGAWMR